MRWGTARVAAGCDGPATALPARTATPAETTTLRAMNIAICRFIVMLLRTHRTDLCRRSREQAPCGRRLACEFVVDGRAWACVGRHSPMTVDHPVTSSDCLALRHYSVRILSHAEPYCLTSSRHKRRRCRLPRSYPRSR